MLYERIVLLFIIFYSNCKTKCLYSCIYESIQTGVNFIVVFIENGNNHRRFYRSLFPMCAVEEDFLADSYFRDISYDILHRFIATTGFRNYNRCPNISYYEANNRVYIRTPLLAIVHGDACAHC